jgi:hypothetical protein
MDIQPLIDAQSLNPCLISTSQTSVSQIYVLQILKAMFFFKLSNRCPIHKSMSLFKLSNRRPILKFMVVSLSLKSTSNNVTDVFPFYNPYPNQ